MKTLTKLSIAVVLAVGTSGTAQAATLINVPSNGTVGFFGEPDTATFGQTITVPTIDNILNSFTFYIDGFDNPDVLSFAGYVAPWNDITKTIGPVLYESGPRSTIPQSGFGNFTFGTGNLALVPGTKYALFVSASKYFDGVQGQGQLGFGGTNNPYSGGDFIFADNGSNFASLATTTWEVPNSGDLAFIAEFSSPITPQPVPEPASMLGILAFGALGGGNLLRRRKQKAAQSAETLS